MQSFLLEQQQQQPGKSYSSLTGKCDGVEEFKKKERILNQMDHWKVEVWCS